MDTSGFNESSAYLVVQRLEHIARWRKIVELANPASRIKAEDVHLEILRPDENGQWQPMTIGSNVRLEYEFKDGVWQQPQFKVKLTNNSQRRLYCMLFDLPETYGLFPMLIGGGVWLDPGQEAWANDGEPLYGWVLNELWQQGVVELKDTLKLIVSTDESDASQLKQEDLPVTVMRGVSKSVRAIAHMNTLNRLMHRVQTRNFTLKPASAEIFADWMTAEISFTTVRPLEASDVAKPGQKVPLGHGVTVLGHPRLQARARLTSLPQAGRDAGNLTLPALLRDHPDVAQPFEFSTSRSGEPGLSVLELVDVQNHTAVTPDDPLVVQIDATLGEDEYLLPVGHDGEFFLPLGRVERAEAGLKVALERLPAPTSAGTRDLKGSIKILFQKLVGQRLGWKYDYPQLTVADVDEAGKVTYIKDMNTVRDKISQANKILLYIHGIIGDTRGMAASAFPQRIGLPDTIPVLADRYQVILTFDYENIHTSIEENARLLKQRLAEVGLGPDHGKALHIVAHSMGGLVSRWFIEREGGNQIVQHLVILGTPNAGSPWPTVQDWATVALSIGLNALAEVAWPVKALSMLVKALEKVDVSLDQMKPGSELLQALATSPNPGIPYTIIAGNTSIISAALQPEAGKDEGAFERLWERIKPKNWLHAVTAPVFFGEPNDIAVSVESIQGVAADRTPQPRVVEPVACDHITYFSSTLSDPKYLRQIM